jgi:rubrerythrin
LISENRKEHEVKARILITVLLVLTATVIASAANIPATKTLDNLQAAFNGESNAHARYLEFAKKADTEGYVQAAALFRAAARAEEIHAANHSVVIKKLGGTPTAKIDKVVVNSTKANLEAAVKGETYERDTMYPEFLKEAKAAGNKDAVITFNEAKTAEAEHARLYADALNNLDKMKVKGVTYYVCTVCGYTTTKLDFNKCPSCFSPKDKYVVVS